MTIRRTLPVLVLLALFVAGGLVAGWIYTHPAASGEAVPWHLTGMGGANSSFADSQINDRLVLRVHVEQWPVDIEDDSWLVQSVDMNASQVTITLHPDADHPLHKEGLLTVGWYDTGGWVNVRLPEPVGRRELLDGSTSPPELRCNTLACY